MSVSFQRISQEHLPVVTSTYNYYVENTTATFHLALISEKEMEATLDVGSNDYPSFAIYFNNEYVGFCYFNRFRKKQAYDITAEVTLYLENQLTGKGIGGTVLNFLEEQAKGLNIKNLIGVITAENTASIKLFEKCGYHQAALLKNVGIKFNHALDVAWMQKEI